jgi:peroxiredoxin
MFNKCYWLLLCTFTFGCNTAVENKDIEIGDVQIEGVVSDNPPGADDWIDSDTAATMTSSYENCSNEIQMWTEPDPLTRPCNFQLIDQGGNHVELYDFEGDVILLDFSTMWCRVCKDVAEHTQELHDKYDPFSIITILTEDTGGNTPTVDQLMEWADEYGITTSPVLSGDDTVLGTDPDTWNVVGTPSFFLIDKDFHLRIVHPGWNEDTITEEIEMLLAE